MSARYDGRGDTPTITRRRHVLACARCRARRVKCDRAQPSCSNCVKAGALCQSAQHQSPAPTTSASSSRPGKKDPNDKLRLSKLEEEVARLSKEVDSKSPSREPSLPGSPVDAGFDWQGPSQGKICYGNRTRYFGPGSWAAVPDEVADLQSVLADEDIGSYDSTSDAPNASPLDQQRPVPEQELPLPNDQLHDTLLGLYSHRVDPLVRILHWPSFLEHARDFRRRRAPKMQPPESTAYASPYFAGASFETAQPELFADPSIIRSQTQDHYVNAQSTGSFDSGFAALLFAVYYAAIVSVIDSPNPPDLGRNINAFSLAATFKREITNRAMTLDAKVARIESLEHLQAMVLYLSVEPTSFESQLPWLQLGVAIRLAHSLGVHRDGTHFDLRPIESECRRRLWAQICNLDARIGEHLGREPTITMGTYDTALPLSISDGDLSEIHEHDGASRRGKETNFKTYQEIESSLEGRSPFSPMTFLLVETEAARMMAHLSSRRCHPRDSIFQWQLSRTNSFARSERSHWISRFEHRFRSVYEVDQSDASHPMQYLASEMINLIILKVKFVSRMLEWREAYGRMSEVTRAGERNELLREAFTVCHRSLMLIHQYSGTPYGWYTKRLRDVYASSFLAIMLASEDTIDPDISGPAWSTLGQLFPVDETGRLVESAVAGSVLGKVLQKARMKQLQSHNTAAFPMPMTPTSTDPFGGFDPMQESDPLWAAGLSGVDNPFGNWTVQTPRDPSLQIPLRPRSQPYGPPRTYETPIARGAHNSTTTATSRPRPQMIVEDDPIGQEEMQEPLLARSVESNMTHVTPRLSEAQVLPPNSGTMLFDGTLTHEPAQNGHLELPTLRTRSISQPQPIDMKRRGLTSPGELMMTAHLSPAPDILRPHSYYGHEAIGPYSTSSFMTGSSQGSRRTNPVKVCMTN